MKKNTARIHSAIATMFFWTTSGGHHALSANYTDEIGTVEGVVIEVFWANPHVHYYIEVNESDSTTVLWDLESSNLNSMASAGWTRDTISVGDRIRVSGRMGLEGRRRLALDRDSLEFVD